MTVEQPVGHHGQGMVALLRVLPREVKVLLFARLVNRIGAFSMPFLSVLLVNEFYAALTTAGFVVGCFGIATIPSRLLGGLLAHRFGARAAVLIGLSATAAAQLIIAAAPTLVVAVAGAALLGLSFEIYEPASQALIADVTPGELLPRAFGLLGATLAVAGLLAGVVAALVAGTGLRWLFVVDACTAALCVLLVAALLPTTQTGPAPERGQCGSRPWRDRRLLALMVTGTVFATVYLSVPMAMPLALIAAGSSASVAGWLAALGALVVIVAQPLLAGRGSVARRLMGGHVLIATGLIVAAVAPSVAGYGLATAVMSLGDVLLLGYVYTLVARIAPEGARAQYFAAYGITWGIALTIGPPMMGVLMQVSPSTFWTVGAGAMLMGGVATAVVAARRD